MSPSHPKKLLVPSLSPMLTLAIGLALLVGMRVTVLQASATQLPETIKAGGKTLILNGHGTRKKLLFVDLYSLALYLPQRMSDVQEIRHESTPKAFRLKIVYGGDKPDQIPESWREELIPALSETQTQQLKQAYANLRQGDIVWITYTPQSGTQLMINNQTVLSDSGQRLISGFIDLWLGQNPVSEALREALIKRKA